MGAFDYGFYKKGMDGTKDTRLGAGLIAIKKELIFNGFSTAMTLDPIFGDAASKRLGEFQANRGLTVDNQVGPTTCKELFRKRVGQIEAQYKIPTGDLGKQIWLESEFDPIAKGVADPADTGIAQINLTQHPEVTAALADDPVYSLNWAAEYITAAQTRIITEIGVLKAARASYNIGAEYAKDWLLEGFPTSGGPQLGTDDAFTRATNYIALIDKQTW